MPDTLVMVKPVELGHLGTTLIGLMLCFLADYEIKLLGEMKATKLSLLWA